MKIVYLLRKLNPISKLEKTLLHLREIKTIKNIMEVLRAPRRSRKCNARLFFTGRSNSNTWLTTDLSPFPTKKTRWAWQCDTLRVSPPDLNPTRLAWKREMSLDRELHLTRESNSLLTQTALTNNTKAKLSEKSLQREKQKHAINSDTVGRNNRLFLLAQTKEKKEIMKLEIYRSTTPPMV